jgi:hypothetical protein
MSSSPRTDHPLRAQGNFRRLRKAITVSSASAKKILLSLFQKT